MQVRVTTKSRVDAWSKVELTNIDNAARALTEAIVNNARVKAPMKTGALRSDGRVEGRERRYAAVFGDERVPYARYQEFGKLSWHFTTPGTGPAYLAMAGDQVSQRGIADELGITRRGIEIFL